MSDLENIVCKPTRWFLFRALVMLVMFGVFSVLFYKDGATGYRKANEIFYLRKAFDRAAGEFEKMNGADSLSPEKWKTHAASQQVEFPVEPSLLPDSLKRPMEWPQILQDHERMKNLQTGKKLWLEYSKIHGLPAKPVEHPYDAGKITGQWWAFSFCAFFTASAAFVLLRTIRRSISADGEGITSQQGRKIPYGELKTLDLRKWDTKGLAYLDYAGTSGKGRIRIDGLTYGGFKEEDGQPAERLMKLVRSRFAGEILEYAAISESVPHDDGKFPSG
jgi:hypothetical protein